MSGYQNDKIFLFAVDLEDVRLGIKNGKSFKERVPENTHAYLEWLRRYSFKCTFFTTGNVAELYPSLIKDIVQEGHEIACHTSHHIPIDQQSPHEFRKDLENNIAVLMKSGASKIHGFRAPVYSLTEKTQWVYEILADLNISYSSSVLPAKNPFYGWEEFGYSPRKMNNKVVEIPLTVGKFGHFAVPVFSGIYFRVLPEFFIRNTVKKIQSNMPIVAYFHPYDIDTKQEKFMHPGINNNRFYNFLMYYNRKKVFGRLNGLIAAGLKICTYNSFVTSNFQQ